MVNGMMSSIRAGRRALSVGSFCQQKSLPSIIRRTKTASPQSPFEYMLWPSHSGTLGAPTATYNLESRRFSSRSSADGHEPTSSSDDPNYVSPFKDIFDRMEANGPTSLGTTQEIIDMEKAFEANQKKLKCGIPENVLRFSTMSYNRLLVEPHVHVNEHRVVMKLNTKYLPFTSQNEFEILREIVGKRLNDDRRELRLTSNKFASRIENKRHLVSMLDRIVLSCQKIGAEFNNETDSQDTG